jgi:hypothetical protein
MHLTPFDRNFAIVSAVAVAMGLLAGFLVLGTPGQQRLIAADRQRLQDLSDIAQNLYGKASNTRDPYKLPTALTAGSFRTDPITRSPYEYRRVSDSIYQLCAKFDTDSNTYSWSNRTQNADTDRWQHPRGRHCFEFNVKEQPPSFYY